MKAASVDDAGITEGGLESDFDPGFTRTLSGSAHLRLPPQSIDAEQSVLGGLLIDNAGWESIGDRLSASDFYRREHGLIYGAIERLIGLNTPADVLTVSDALAQTGELEVAGGLACLASLAQNVPSAANIMAYATIVRERAILRRLVQASNEIGSSAYETAGRSVAQILDSAEKRIFDIRDQGARLHSGFRPLKEFLGQAADRIDRLYHADSPITGVATGYSDLDGMTAGLQRGDLIIVAGRPSMGKTTLAINIAERAAIHDKVPVAVFSMEMSGEQLAMRMMGSIGRIDAHRIRTGKLHDDEWPRLTHAMGQLDQAPIFIDDTGDLTPMEIRARVRRIKRQHGLGLIVLDYIQLMQSSGENVENRATEVSNITRALKSLAREMDVPLIALSQLNRSLEQRPNKRPVMSDLRESGAIEQDADVILFIYRDEVYNKDSPDKGTAEIIIGKQRNGPTGDVRLTFLGQYTRFENYTYPGDGDRRPF